MSKIVSHGHWNELSNQCKQCENLRTFSIYMNGDRTFCCGKYPLQEGETCPMFKKMSDDDGQALRLQES